MKISQTNFSMFKPMSREERQEVHSNPFGINFKGNVLTSDVFETTRAKEAKTTSNPFEAFTKISNKSKMVASAIVGGMNSFNEAFRSRVNSVVAFGRQVRDNIASSWERAKNTEITIDFKGMADAISSRFNNTYSVNNLLKRPVDDLSTMLTAEIESYRQGLKA